MKKCKSIFKVFIFFVVGLIVFSGFSQVKASADASVGMNPEDPCVTDFKDYESKESELISSDLGNTVYEISNLEKAAEDLNVPLVNEEGEELIGLAYSYTNTDAETDIGVEDSIEVAAGSGLYVKVTGTGEACGTELIRSSYYKGPSTATMKISEGVTASFNASVSVSAKIVTSGVGFNVSKSYTVEDTYTIKIPSGKTYNIKARPILLTKNFQVWHDPLIGWDTKKGSGSAHKPIGVCFSVYK